MPTHDDVERVVAEWLPVLEQAHQWQLEKGYLSSLPELVGALKVTLATQYTAGYQKAVEQIKERQKGWLGTEEDGSDRHPFYDELQTILDTLADKNK
jgi:hypothetical protein